MSSMIKGISKKEQSEKVTVVKKMKNYSSEPVFQKKAEKASAFLKKHGMPPGFLKKGK